jgi:transglycosylase-like protein
MPSNKPLAGGIALAALTAPVSVALAGSTPKLDHDVAARARLGARIVGVGMRRAAHDQAARQVVRLEREVAHLRGRHAPHGLRAHVARLSTQQLLRRERTLRREARSLRSAATSATGGAAVAVSPALQAIAACESGGNPQAIGGGGVYRGKYQFTYATWASVGGTGDPAAAPVAEQDRRAAMLYAQDGPSQWPVCGR